MTSSEMRRSHEVAGLALLSDLAASLVGGAPADETVSLICRTISRLAGFRFCGVLVPDATWSSFHLAGGHGFPPEYVDRLNELFLVPVGEQQRDSPTRQAAEQRRTIVNTDVHAGDDFAPWRDLAQMFGYRSLVSVPLIVDGETIGVLNGYSSGERRYTPEELASIETLAAQAAISLRVSTLMEARRETIARLQEANDALESQRRTLERAHEIHQGLTAAALTGSDAQQIARLLAELIDAPVSITHPDGSPHATSDPDPSTVPNRLDPGAVTAEIRIPGELLGHVTTRGEGDRADDLRQRAVEHAATVLALEAVKERVVQAAEDRLRTDFITDLLRGRLDDDADAAPRALRHGLDVDRSHRVAILRLGDDAALAQVRAELLRGPGTIVVGSGSTLTALVPEPNGDDLATRVAGIRSQLGAGVDLAAGIGAPTTGIADFAESHRGAELCLDLAGRLERTDITVVRDALGLLAFFVDTRNPDELLANARRVLGPASDHDLARSGALIDTLTVHLDNGCSTAATAERLFVHANTVKYRLRQVEQLCHLDFRNPDDLLLARIATLTLRLLRQ